MSRARRDAGPGLPGLFAVLVVLELRPRSGLIFRVVEHRVPAWYRGSRDAERL